MATGVESLTLQPWARAALEVLTWLYLESFSRVEGIDGKETA